MLEQNVEALQSKIWIVADSAYLCSSVVLTPWPGKSLPIAKDCFNCWLSSARRIIEQAFSVLVAGWGILWRKLRESLGKASQAKIVCCNLRNFIVENAGNEIVSINESADVSSTLMEIHLQYECIDIQGRRLDRKESSKRDKLTKNTGEFGFERPP